MKYLIKSILAGIMIGIGGTVCLSIDNKIIGATLFSIGLFMIVVYGLNLFTGKIGYLITNHKKEYIKELIITLFGNFIGTFLTGMLMKLTRISTIVVNKAKVMISLKLSDGLLSILILSIFCGLLMYLAVNGYKTIKEDLGKYLAVFLGVIVFILCGFEHCIANMYYFTLSGVWSLKTVLYLFFMIIGNSIGSFIFPIGDLIIKGRKEKK